MRPERLCRFRNVRTAPSPEPRPARDHAREQYAVEHESGAQRGEHPRERAGQVQHEPAADDGDEQAQEPGEDRPEQTAGALGGEVEAQAEAEEAVGRSDDAQVGGAGREHARVVAEQPEPRLRPDRSGKADRLGDAEGERAADERDAQRALPLAGADVGADQGHERRAEAEHQRDQQVLQPRAGAVAGDRVGAGGDRRPARW